MEPVTDPATPVSPKVKATAAAGAVVSAVVLVAALFGVEVELDDEASGSPPWCRWPATSSGTRCAGSDADPLPSGEVVHTLGVSLGATGPVAGPPGARA